VEETTRGDRPGIELIIARPEPQTEAPGGVSGSRLLPFPCAPTRAREGPRAANRTQILQRRKYVREYYRSGAFRARKSGCPSSFPPPPNPTPPGEKYFSGVSRPGAFRGGESGGPAAPPPPPQTQLPFWGGWGSNSRAITCLLRLTWTGGQQPTGRFQEYSAPAPLESCGGRIERPLSDGGGEGSPLRPVEATACSLSITWSRAGARVAETGGGEGVGSPPPSPRPLFSDARGGISGGPGSPQALGVAGAGTKPQSYRYSHIGSRCESSPRVY